MRFYVQTRVIGLLTALFMSILPADAAASQLQQPGDETLLNALLTEALENNGSLNAKRLRAKASWEIPARVSSLPDPVFGVGYQPYPIYTARGAQRVQLQLEQDIPFPGKLGLQEKIAEYSAMMAEYDVGVAARLLIYQVKASYYELYRLQQQSLLIEAFRSQLSDLVASSTARYKVGHGSQQDILKAQLERNQLDEYDEDLIRQTSTETEVLARLLNRRDGAGLLSKTYSVDRAATTIFEAGIDSSAKQNRPELLSRKTAIQQSEKQVELAEKMLWPDFTIGVHYFDIASSDLTPTMTGANALGVQLKLSIPLWRDGLKAGVTESQLLHQEKEALLRDVEIEISTQINAAWGQLKSEQRTLQIYENTLIPQAETTLQASLNAYASDQADFLDLLDAERTIFGMRMAHIETVARMHQYVAALTWALGDKQSGYNSPHALDQ